VDSKSLVVLVPCADYEPDLVLRAVSEALEPLDLMDAISRDKPVLLKPNLLMPAAPEKCVTTHPSVFAAVGRIFQEKGFRLVYGDSPNGVFKPEATAIRSGIHTEAQALGIPLVEFSRGRDVSFPGGMQNRRFHVAEGVLDSGFLVNLPKMKTHGLCMVTGALKNTFGVIPGARKAEFHIRHPDAEGFSRMIVDLNALVPSGLVVMDAVRAMEGNGPGSGTPVKIGLIIASRDPVAVDAVACRIMGVDPLSVHAVRIAAEAGLGNAAEDRIEIVGSGKEIGMVKPFTLPRHAPGAGVPRFLMRFAKNIAVPKPFIAEARCSRCGQCVVACPASPKALSQTSGAVPRYDYGICVRCYCCQEICPNGAISLKSAAITGFFEGRS
jgi:uncharacterized protein (DUF362 family)/Pyruvate/2-oxoacid:ferredoxin oxidoreductase delta subunit